MLASVKYIEMSRVVQLSAGACVQWRCLQHRTQNPVLSGDILTQTLRQGPERDDNCGCDPLCRRENLSVSVLISSTSVKVYTNLLMGTNLFKLFKILCIQFPIHFRFKCCLHIIQLFPRYSFEPGMQLPWSHVQHPDSQKARPDDACP